MSKKREKRLRELSAELQEDVAVKVKKEVVETRDDDNLFTVDRAGSKAKKRKVAEEIIPQLEGKFLSKTEKHLVQKTLKRIQEGKDRKPYGSDVVNLFRKGAKDAVQGKVATKLHDIWSEGEDSDNSKARPHKKAFKVPLPGQSYHPSADEHQEVLAQAVSLELQRIEKGKSDFNLVEAQRRFQEQQKQQLRLDDDSDDSDDDTPNRAVVEQDPNAGKRAAKYAVDAQRLRQITSTLLDEQTDVRLNNDEDDDSNDGSSGTDSDGKKRQRTKQLTKAQRNKRRARKVAQHEEKLESIEKKKGKDIERLKRIQQELEAEAKRRETEQQIRETVEQEKQREEEEKRTKRLRPYEVTAVPLSDELEGSLRRMRPKGVPLADQTQALIMAGEMNAAFARKRRAYERPHAAKKVKWYPKYKVAADVGTEKR